MSNELQRCEIICEQCSWKSVERFATNCPLDGMMLIPQYPALSEDATLLLLQEPFCRRFSSVIPIRNDANCRETAPVLSPLIRANDLGLAFGIGRLFLKDETTLPTGSTKARMAGVTLAYLLERGVQRFAVNSTGNSTNAMARLMPLYPELEMTAFIGREFLQRHVIPQSHNIRLVPVDGDFVDAERVARATALSEGLTWEGGFFNPARRVGLATSYLEACCQMGSAPYWYFQAVSSGMGVVAVGEFAKCQVTGNENGRIPHLVAVQQQSCAPMATAFAEGSDRIEDRHRIRHPSGIAHAILRGDPSASYPVVRRHVLESGGDIVSVTDEEIMHAQSEANRLYGIPAGPSAGAALAAALRFGLEGRIGKDESVLVNLSGRQ